MKAEAIQRKRWGSSVRVLGEPTVMPIPVDCTCGKALKIPEQFAGKRVKCPKCGAGVDVPASPSVSTPTPPPGSLPAAKPAATPSTPPPPGMVRFNCSCGKQMQAKAEFAGRMTKCPTCGSQLPIPKETPKSPDVQRNGTKPEGSLKPEPKAKETTVAEAATEQKSVRRWPAFSHRSIGLMVGVPLLLIGAGAGAMWLFYNGEASNKAPLPVDVPVVAEVKSNEPAPASLDNLRQIGAAMLKYHGEKNKFPLAAVLSKDGKPLYSWRVELLPFLDEKSLYDQVKKDEPWDGPTNKTLWDKMPKCYALPDKPGEPSKTFYQVFTGPKALFGRKLLPRLSEISDGNSKTILVAEAAQAVNWMSPVDLAFNPSPAGVAPSLLGGHFGEVFHVIMADGTPLRVSRTIKPETLQAAITPAGREILGPDWDAAIGR